MKCCNSCIHGDSTNNICHTCIGSKYEAKSVEEQDTKFEYLDENMHYNTLTNAMAIQVSLED